MVMGRCFGGVRCGATDVGVVRSAIARAEGNSFDV